MQVVVPSSSTVRKTFLLRDQTVICNANWCDRRESLQFVSKEITLDSAGSIPPMVDNKDLRCMGRTTVLQVSTWHKGLGKDLLLYCSVGLPEH
jgi:hypothetical protein